MADRVVDLQDLCDCCRRARWQVEVFTGGQIAFAYCVRCVIGVLRDRPDATSFVVRYAGGQRVQLADRKALGEWLEREPLDVWDYPNWPPRP